MTASTLSRIDYADRFGNPLVRMLWAAVKPTHVRTVTSLLEDARRR